MRLVRMDLSRAEAWGAPVWPEVGIAGDGVHSGYGENTAGDWSFGCGWARYVTGGLPLAAVWEWSPPYAAVRRSASGRKVGSANN